MKAIAVLLLCLSSSQAAFADHSKPTPRDVAAIVQAVEDEIYDWGFENDYTNIGTTGAISSPTDVPLFIFPELNDDGRGGVIYRFMPFGEVLRQFTLLPDGMVVLEGNPLNGFPATQPDTKTIYVDDDFICAYKQKAIRASFTVDPNISRARREEAARRQVMRVGHSQFLEGRSNKNTRTGSARP
ncbi:MAG: hypothetical protein ACLQMT_06345 [Candidatus Acidiferrales bacterium]